MIDLRTGGALEAAAWKVRNLEDFGARLERAARRVDEIDRAHETAALVILEAALTRSGRPIEEVRETVRRFEETDRKSTRLNSSHANISYAVFCLKKKTHYS